MASRYLADVVEQFEAGGKGFPRARGRLEIVPAVGESLLDESIEVVDTIHVRELYLLHSLVLWADGVGRYVVRETVKKRLDRVVFGLDEFAAGSDPLAIAQTFWRCRDKLRTLTVPPGTGAADQRVLLEIEEMWLALGQVDAQ